MKRLTDTVKRRIVEHLACYRSHAETVQLIASEFGIEITSRHIRAYDPDSYQFAGARRWVDYHQMVRNRYAQEVGGIAIAHKAYRLRKLQHALDDAMASENHRLAMKLLEQAAREMGGCYRR